MLFLKIEVALLFMLLIAALGASRSLSMLLRPLMHLCRRLGSSDAAGPIAAAIVGLTSAVLITSIRAPVPAVHDEFSYLLAADTFAHARLANPTHPMWKFFETFHVIQQPVYASKYQPGQGLLLACGQLLSGKPIVGVWLATAALSAAMAWMLAGFLPRRWANLGALLVALHPLLQFSWGQSFWGGTLPMLGAALAFGAAPRLIRVPSIASTLWLCAGVAVLANTRPYEGIVVLIPLGCWLIIGLLKNHRLPTLAARIVIPSMLALGAVAAGMLHYNARLTGSALRLPYSVHESQYGISPMFLWGEPRSGAEFNHPTMAAFQYGWAMDAYRKQTTWQGILVTKGAILGALWQSYLWPLLALPLFALLRMRRQRGIGLAFATVVCSVIGALPVCWLQPNYLAPALPMLWLLIVSGLRGMFVWRLNGRTFGAAIVSGIVLVRLAAFGMYLALHIAAQPQGWQWDRARLEAELTHRGGQHLVVVQYGAQHNTLQEWVYNSADPDGSAVVWARSMGAEANRPLLDYYANRKIWLLSADAQPPKLSPYRQPAKQSQSTPAKQTP